jgi:hypothetical protein
VRKLVQIGVLIATSGLLLGPNVAADASSKPVRGSTVDAVSIDSALYIQRRIVNDCDHLVARPTHIDWCGNTGDEFRSLTWSSWRAHEARARGILRANDCRPSCADGTFHRYGVSLRLHRDVRVNGHPRFLRVTYLFLNGPYAGERYTLPLPRKPYR